jgi:hypothetical protein
MAQLGHNVYTGTLVSDANEANLLAGSTLNAAGSTNGTAVQIDRPGDVAFVLETSTVTGTNPVLTVVVQGSEVSDFSDDVVTLATLKSTGATEDNKSYSACAEVYKKFVRAVVDVAGTSPVYTGSTLKVKQPHFKRTKDTTAYTIV